jgi:chitinase
MASNSIDLVLVQAYNNWYDGLTEGSLQYLQDTYLNWINQPSPYCTGCTIIANFTGITQKKLVLGVPASNSAGQNAPSGSTIDQFQNWLQQNNYTMAGAFIWDSHWDSANQYTMSNAILTASTNTPLTPSTPTTTSLICPAASASPSAQDLNILKKKLSLSLHPK